VKLQGMPGRMRWLLPVGLERVLEAHREFLRLGVSSSNARRWAVRPRKAGSLRRTRASLLPDGALADVRGVIDVGANVGRWSGGILQLCQPQRLLALEPQPSVLGALRSRIGSNPCVEIIEAAVGRENGTIDFHVTSHVDGASVLRPREEMNVIYGVGYDIVETIPVPVRRLDDLAADLDEVTLLKIDVQGYEQFVIEGGEETLRRTRHVVLEVLFASHYENDLLFADLDRMMTARGFALVNIAPAFAADGLALWSDAVYSRRNAAQ
jgi:FkbM family methyltransferase